MGKPGFIFSPLCIGFCVLNSLISFLIPLLSDITDWLLFCLIYFTDFHPRCWERPFLVLLHGWDLVVFLWHIFYIRLSMNIWATSVSRLLLTVSAVCSVLISSGIKGKKCDFMWVRWRNIEKKKFVVFSFLRAPHPFLLLGDLVLLISLPKNWLSHYLSCLIVNGLCHVSLLKLASKSRSDFSSLCSTFPSLCPEGWTAPKPSEHSLPRSRGFSVAVMRCVHKVAALPHSPLPLMEPKEP